MSDTIRRTRVFRIVAVVAALTGCGDAFILPPANAPVARHQITLYALHDTPVGTPSAYNMIQLAEVQVFRSNDFDFVFDLGPDSSFGLGTTGDTIAVLMPRGYLGFGADGGLQFTLIGFDSIQAAPEGGYEYLKPTRIRGGDAVFAASRLQSCNVGIIRPRYAKLFIQSIDLVTRSASILVIIDTNCGYRGLGSGIPTF